MRYFYTISENADTARYNTLKSDITVLYPAYSPEREVKEADGSQRITFEDTSGNKITAELDNENHRITVTSDTELSEFAEKYSAEKEILRGFTGIFGIDAVWKKITLILNLVIMPIIVISSMIGGGRPFSEAAYFWEDSGLILALIFIPAALIAAAAAKSNTAYKIPLGLFLIISMVTDGASDVMASLFFNFFDFFDSLGKLYLMFLPLIITDRICGKIRDKKFGDRITEARSFMINLSAAGIALLIFAILFAVVMIAFITGGGLNL